MSKQKNNTQKQQTAKEKEDCLCQKLTETQEKLANALSLAREYKADMERMKQRAKEVEMQKTIEVATKAVLEILPVIDNFELALQKITDEQTAKGLKLIHAQLAKVVEDMGAKQIENGTEFNPELHNAISSIDSDELESDTIALVYQKGYKVGDKIIRHSMVQTVN